MLDAHLIAVAQPDLPTYPYRYYVTSNLSGASGAPDGVWSVSSGAVSNATALSAEVDVPPQQGVLVTLVLTDESESVTRTLSIFNSTPAPPPAPATPPLPTLAKNCADGTFSVAASGLPAHVDLLELRRQKAGDTAWTTVHTWALAGATTAPAWVDEAVSPFVDWVYALRGGNVSGFSAWGAGATARLESSTLTLALTAPATFTAPLSGHFWLEFHLADSSTAPTCDLELSVSLGGVTVAEALLFAPTVPGDSETIRVRNGTYRLRLDSRLFRQGVQDLVITARGGDCCLRRLVQSLTLQNDLSSAVDYKDFDYPYTPLPGYEWVGAHLAAESRALAIPMRDRYYLQSRVSAASSVAAGAAGWAAMQPVELQAGQSYGGEGTFPLGRPASIQLRGSKEKLVPGGGRVLWRTQWTPLEALSWYGTGYDEIVKIRPLAASGEAAQQFMLLCRDEDGSRAGVLLFDGSVHPYEVTPLVAREDGDLLDACIVGDQVYTLPDSTRIAVYDRDAGQFEVELRIPDEPRPLRFLENVGGAPLVFAVDADATLKTSIRDLTFAARTPLYQSALELTAIGQREGPLIGAALGFGSQLWTMRPSGLPTLSHTFPVPLNFVTPTLVGLSDGTLWSYDAAQWQPRLGAAVGAQCAAPFRGAASAPRGVAGGGSLQLLEQSPDNAAFWFAGHLLEVPATVLGSADTTEVSALFRWLKPAPAAAAGEEAPLAPDALLIGTRSGGLLGVLEQTDPATVPGAIVVSELFLPTLDPVMGVKESG